MDENRGDGRRGVFPRLSGESGSEYDALADLFLGDGDLAPAPATVRGTAPVPPVGVAPTVRAEGTAVRREADPAPDRGRVVEAVLLGHLPVRASIWVRQYAQSVASAVGARVGLVRLGPEASSVELLGVDADEAADGQHGTAPTLEDALRDAAPLADRWIVRVDETAEPTLAECEGIDEVTILTGADEAAVVASYRLVKSLAAAWDRRFGADGGPTLGLAIMGSTGEQALAASEKLERAAEAFLERPIRVTARVPKIGVGAAATLFRGAGSTDAEAAIGLLRRTPAELHLSAWRPGGVPERAGDAAWLGEEIEFEPEAVDPDGLDSTLVDAEGLVSGGLGPYGAGSEGWVVDGFDTGRRNTETIEEDAVAPTDERTGGASDAIGAREEAAVIVTRAIGEVVPRRVASAEADRGVGRSGPERAPEIEKGRPQDAASATAAVASEEVGPLAALLGLRALETRCPYAGRVEMAADEAGGLHLLADEGADGRESAGQLLAAAAWARDHMALLLRAEPLLAHPSSDGARSGEPGLHLFTRAARGVRPLLDSEMRIHLVTRVTLGDRSGWVACELN